MSRRMVEDMEPPRKCRRYVKVEQLVCTFLDYDQNGHPIYVPYWVRMAGTVVRKLEHEFDLAIDHRIFENERMREIEEMHCDEVWNEYYFDD